LDPGTGKDATRLAVNIGLLALEEAHLDQAFDPASGAYLLEILTHELASAAWSQFQSSARNDLFKDILDGNIQKPILETAKEFLSRVVSGEQVLVGVNKHQSPLARKSPPMPVQKAVELPEFTPLEPVFADA
jgi:methylmalonyl-CoA mutase